MRSTSRGGFCMAARVAVVVIAAAVATCSSASGRELHPMIVGGQPAPVGSFGMMAFVAYFVGTTPEFVCSGTVVSSDVVLTAGHCGEDTTTGIAYQAAGYRIVTSSLDWTSTATRQISNVSQVIVNPGYSPATGDSDAAMLVLSTPTTAPAIALASDPGDVTLLEPGTGGEIAGWGATAVAPLTAQLQWGQDVVQDPAYCVQQAGQLGGVFNSGDQVCAIDAPTDADGACNGDSGGPLVVQRPDSTWVEVGVINRGPTDCSTGKPDFFTRADAIYSWVQSWISIERPLPAPPPAPAPSSPPPTPPAPPAARPSAGIYRGQTSQHRNVSLRVGSSGGALSALRFGFRLRCTQHPALFHVIAPIAGSLPHWSLSKANGLGFGRTFYNASGTRYQVSGLFTTTGAVSGTLKASRRASQYGACTSGLVHWHAALTG